MKISRRTIMAAAAGLFVPRINLRPAIDREALLAQFVDPHGYSIRFNLDKPFDYDGLAYATDARIMCRTQLVSAEHDGKARLPNVVEAWQKYAVPAGSWRTEGLPAVAELTVGHGLGVCPACEDRRVSLGEHYPDEESLEYGGMYYPLDYDMDDNTIRDATCYLCHGLDYDGPSCVDLCGAHIRYDYARKMFSLPGVQFAPSKEDGCLLFRADEFEGVAMGVNP